MLFGDEGALVRRTRHTRVSVRIERSLALDTSKALCPVVSMFLKGFATTPFHLSSFGRTRHYYRADHGFETHKASHGIQFRFLWNKNPSKWDWKSNIVRCKFQYKRAGFPHNAKEVTATQQLLSCTSSDQGIKNATGKDDLIIWF